TKVVASAIPVAVSRRFETPMNGHSPRNFTSTKLFTSTALMRMSPRLARFSVIVFRRESAWCSLYFHARLRALIRLKNEQLLPPGTGRQHHALGNAEAHLARRKIGNHD